MKYIKEYLKDVIKVKPLGELTTKDDELDGISGEMVYIDGKCSNIFISHIDYANWLEKQGQDPKKVLIWKHWKNGIAGNGEGKLIYLIKIGNTYKLSSCLGVECDYIELSELNNLLIENQSEQKSDNSYCQENCKGFQETGKCFADGDCKAKREAKSTNKVEPKFKVGDWISNDMCDVHIASIEDGMYYFDEGDGLSIVFVDEHYHIWTIEDAIDGDVLFHSDSASNGIFIFKEILHRGTIQEVICYCDYDSEDGFCLGEKHTCCWTDAKILHPATKEQRDFLFQKMKEAGYEWDSQKKELKIIDWSKHIKYEPNSPSIIEENTTWSEEDEDHLNSLIELLPGLTIRHKWLKSLKDRVQLQPKQEWSEEDEKRLNSCLNILRPKTLFGNTEISNIDTINTKWLKSLKDRIQPHKQWKTE